MSNLKLNILFAVLLIAILGYAANSTSDEEIESNLIFSHKLHVQNNELECSTCHENIINSSTMKNFQGVKEETCLSCHEKENNCEMCHTNPQNPKFNRWGKDYSIEFNHKFHLNNNLECNYCHLGVVESENLNIKHSPEMKNCMKCHDVTDQIEDCYLCHEPTQNLKPKDHDAMWAKNHGKFKEAGVNECTACHTQNYCIDCHKGENLFGESHPPEFILTHSMSFLARESDCQSCHTDRDFCIECHTEINFVKPATHTLPDWKPWVNGSLHITEGKLNSEYCGVCHSEADPTCTGCHSGWKQ